ncbi:MAG: hypothetical protein ACK559_20260, partial [bacterium]
AARAEAPDDEVGEEGRGPGAIRGDACRVRGGGGRAAGADGAARGAGPALHLAAGEGVHAARRVGREVVHAHRGAVQQLARRAQHEQRVLGGHPERAVGGDEVHHRGGEGVHPAGAAQIVEGAQPERADVGHHRPVQHGHAAGGRAVRQGRVGLQAQGRPGADRRRARAVHRDDERVARDGEGAGARQGHEGVHGGRAFGDADLGAPGA